MIQGNCTYCNKPLIIRLIGFQAKFLDFKIQNMVGSCDVKFPIRLEGLVLTHSQFSRFVLALRNCIFDFNLINVLISEFSYEPELFPGLIYRMVKPRIVLLIFVSGKVVLTGKLLFYHSFKAMYLTSGFVVVYSRS